MFRPHKIKWSDYRSKIVPDAKKQPIRHSQMERLNQGCQKSDHSPSIYVAKAGVRFNKQDERVADEEQDERGESHEITCNSSYFSSYSFETIDEFLNDDI